MNDKMQCLMNDERGEKVLVGDEAHLLNKRVE
jgi:hypothetical protein